MRLRVVKEDHLVYFCTRFFLSLQITWTEEAELQDQRIDLKHPQKKVDFSLTKTCMRNPSLVKSLGRIVNKDIVSKNKQPFWRKELFGLLRTYQNEADGKDILTYLESARSHKVYWICLTKRI